MHANDIAQFLPRWLMGGPGMTKSEPKPRTCILLPKRSLRPPTDTDSQLQWWKIFSV